MKTLINATDFIWLQIYIVESLMKSIKKIESPMSFILNDFEDARLKVEARRNKRNNKKIRNN